MENGRIVREWMRDDFLKLTEDELASFELRPMRLEAKYIKEFSSDSPDDRKNVLINNDEDVPDPGKGAEDIALRNFYFTYTPEKYLFFRKKGVCGKENICQLRVRNLVKGGLKIG